MSFDEYIKLDESSISVLKYKLDNKKITINDLTDEQVKLLKGEYQKEIVNNNKELKNVKNRIKNIKSQIDNWNN